MIKINDEYFIDSDNYNVILVKKKIIEDKKSKNYGKEIFANTAYFNSVQDLLKSLYERKIKDVINEKEYSDYKEFLLEMNRFKKEFEDNVSDLRIYYKDINLLKEE